MVFPKTREQFRIAGTLFLIKENSPDSTLQRARDLAWRELSDAARTQFAWAYPGNTRASDEAFNVPSPDPNIPLPNFCLLLLGPTEVDHLELRGNPQNRWLYMRKDEIWSVEEVNP